MHLYRLRVHSLKVNIPHTCVHSDDCHVLSRNREHYVHMSQREAKLAANGKANALGFILHTQ